MSVGQGTVLNWENPCYHFSICLSAHPLKRWLLPHLGRLSHQGINVQKCKLMYLVQTEFFHVLYSTLSLLNPLPKEKEPCNSRDEKFSILDFVVEVILAHVVQMRIVEIALVHLRRRRGTRHGVAEVLAEIFGETPSHSITTASVGTNEDKHREWGLKGRQR